MSFTNCTVKLEDEILFQPEWGIFDMGVGTQVSSVFAGVADKEEYENGSYISSTNTVTNNYTDKQYVGLYQKVRDLREGNSSNENIELLFQDIKQKYPKDWLFSIELYELALNMNNDLVNEIKNYLLKKADSITEYKKLIHDGIELIEKSKS